MDIARTSMIHAREPHFRWPYALLYAAHQLNLKPRVSRPEVSPTSLWTGSPGVGSAFHVLGCLALVRDTSADKLSARHPRCLPWFPGGLSDYSFYHPPLHQFLDSPPPSPQSSSQSLQQPSALPRQVTVDSVDVGAEGAATGSTRSGGARSRGAGAGGAGAGGASLKGVGSGGSGTGGVSSGGTGAGGARTGGASSGGAGVGANASPASDPPAALAASAPPASRLCSLRAAR
ncbi:unnamed protein product [Closterium sp. NIES-54]